MWFVETLKKRSLTQEIITQLCRIKLLHTNNVKIQRKGKGDFSVK